MKPRITDTNMLEAYSDLVTRGAKVTLKTLGTALRAKHGYSGDTDRRRRFLTQQRQLPLTEQRDREIDRLNAQIKDLQDQLHENKRVGRQQLPSAILALTDQIEAIGAALELEREKSAQAIARAELAEDRERSHQEYWARQNHDLITQLKAAVEHRAQYLRLQSTFLDVSRELQSTKTQLRILQEQLRHLGAANPGTFPSSADPEPG